MSITSIDLRRTGGVAPGVAARAVGLPGQLGRLGGHPEPDGSGRRTNRELTRNRLLTFGAIILLAMLVLVAVSWTGSGGAQRDLETVRDQGLGVLTIEQSIGDGEAIRGSFWMLGTANQLGEAELAEAARLGLADADASLDEHLAEIAEWYASSPTIAPEVTTLTELADEFVASTDALVELSSAVIEPTPEAMLAVQQRYEEWVGQYAALRDQQELLSDLGEDLMSTSSEDADRSAQRRELMILVSGVIVVAVLIVVGRKVIAAVQAMQLLQSEMARVTSMMENSPTGMAFTDLNGAVQYVNPVGIKTIRHLEGALNVRADELVGGSFDLMSLEPARRQEILANPERLLPIEGERRQVGADWVELDLSTIKDDDGTAIGVMTSYRLVTDEVRIEREQEAAAERERAQAAELESKVDALLGAVAAAAEGDLTVDVPISGSDAIGQMGDGIAKLLGDLRGSIASIGHNAEALAAAAEELQVVSEQMGANAAETSSQVSLVTGGSVEVSRNVETVSAGAEQMTASIKEIAKNASEAAKVAGQAVEAATRTNGTVAKLGDSSTEIGQIVKVITGIAQQTNLLALNATIEAARAGEAGKGFAVVANEVKELAKETAKATEDISQKIEAIQGDTGRSVEAIEEIAGIIGQISEFQTTIASAVEEQAATTSDIARSVNDASRGSTEITSNMQAVASAAESTSSGAADSQRAATELAQMAAELQQLVSRFTY